MNGIKLTVFLPLINQQLRAAIFNSTAEHYSNPLYTLVLCHSFLRCQELADTLQEIVTFCSDLVDIVNLDSQDLAEV